MSPSSDPSVPRHGSRARSLLAAGAALGLLAACGGHGRTAAAASGSAAASTSSRTPVREVQGRVGPLVLGDGYVPAPASPDVAAAYLTIINNGTAATRLTAVHSDTAAGVMPMTETSNGGVGTMAPLKNVTVPAHGVFRFRPGADHLMLEQPHPVPVAGRTVSLTLTFMPAGAVTVSLPVRPIGDTGPATGTPSD